MTHSRGVVAACALAAALQACGGSDSPAGTQVTTPAQGQLTQSPPPRVLSLSATDFTGLLQAGGATGQALLQLSTAGTGSTSLPCGIDVYYYKYGTIDGQGKPANASGALMVPTGPAGPCSGARPIVEYTHGTAFSRSYNLANIADSTNPAYLEGIVQAAMYAAQGYIVVAPNYVGFDSSTTNYHPYLVAAQESSDSIDALTAARAALPLALSAISDNGKFFLTGYSQGGYVAMATQRAMEAKGMTVTAASPQSGPYALNALVDDNFTGHPSLSGALLVTLLAESYQNSYGNIYSSPTDIFANNLATQLPYASAAAAASSPIGMTTPLFSAVAPQPPASANALAADFATTVPSGYSASDLANPIAPMWAASFDTSGSQFVVTQSFRAGYLADAFTTADPVLAGNAAALPPAAASAASPLRQDAIRNDLRGYVPKSPTMLCGGHNDAVVYFAIDSGAMQAEWGAPTPTRFTLDIASDAASSASDPTSAFNPVRLVYQQAMTPYRTAAYDAAISAGQTTDQATQAAAIAEAENAHFVELLPCALAARAYFANF